LFQLGIGSYPRQVSNNLMHGIEMPLAESMLGLSGLLMLNYVFPSAAEGCPAWVKPLFQILAALGAIVVVGVLIQHADQISPSAWALGASSLSPS
jgi:hypothetical protein